MFISYFRFIISHLYNRKFGAEFHQVIYFDFNDFLTILSTLITNFFYFFPETQDTKDFGKENYHKIKEIQRANKQKQKESARGEPVKAVYKPGKFVHVESKVAEKIQVSEIVVSFLFFFRAHSFSYKHTFEVKFNKKIYFEKCFYLLSMFFCSLPGVFDDLF